MRYVAWSLVGGAVFGAGNLALFGAPITATWVLAAAGWSAPWGGARWLRALAAASWLAVGAAGWWVPLVEYQDRVDALGARVAAGGPEALGPRDLAGVWVLNLGMALGGVAVGFPEVAAETALLAVPGPAVRTFHGDFAMASPRVRAAAAAIARDGRPRRVAFTYADHTDARVGLALNVLELAGRCEGGRLALVGRVEVDYPERGRLPLFVARGRAIVIDEALFHALEARGWLHPYVAEWRWTADDPACGATPRAAGA